MAEFIFKNMVKNSNEYLVESKAVSDEEIGNPIYPPAQQKLREKGIPFSDHRASRITKEDYEKFDYIIVMESYNLPRLYSIIGMDKDNKVFRLLDFTSQTGDIEDPWFSGNYEKVFQQITEGCAGLILHVQRNK
jgi:protein-tyrosine phosphatase